MEAIDIFTSETQSDSTSLLGGSSKDGEKTSPSLFDSLLKSSVAKNSPVSEFEENKKIETKTMENVNLEKALGTGGSISLLDKLLVEAKTQMGENIAVEEDVTIEEPKKFIDDLKSSIEEKIESKPTNNSTLQETLKNEEELNKKPEIKVENNLEEKSEVKPENKLEIKDNSKAEVKPQNPSSLLDKLLFDAKKEIDATVEQKVDKSINSEIKDEKPINLLDKLLNEAKKDLQNNQEVKVNKDSIPSNIEQKTEIKADSKIEVKIENQSSLLDKLISDAKNIVEVEKKALDNVTKIEVVETTKIETSEEQKEQIKTTNIENKTLNSSTVIVDTKITETKEAKAVLPTQEIKNEPIVKKSLMDALIENVKQKQDEFSSKNSDLTLQTNQTTKPNAQKELASSMFLSEQKAQVVNQLNLNKNEAMNILNNANTLEDVEKSAKLLDLDASEAELKQTKPLSELEKKDLQKDSVDKKTILDSLLNEKNIRSVDVRNLITKSVEASNALIENSIKIADDVKLNVNAPLSFDIQSKIIGARQQMTHMMSDIARQMYENYRPPITVFRINLNPGNLGAIAVLMKNERNSEMSITMSVSNNATLDALVENQNQLRNSLQKTFDENTKFNFNFNSSSDDQRNQDSRRDDGQRNQQNEHIDTDTILKIQEENKELEDRVLEYL